MVFLLTFKNVTVQGYSQNIEENARIEYPSLNRDFPYKLDRSFILRVS